MIEIDTEEIIKLNIEDAYKLYNIIAIEQPEIKKETYHKIRNGIEIIFDIYKHFEQQYTLKEKENIIIMEENEYDLKDYWTEIEQREALIKQTILNAVQTPEIFKGRNLEEQNTKTALRKKETTQRR